MKKYVIGLLILMFSSVVFITAEASNNSNEVYLKRSELLSMMLEVDFANNLENVDLNGINKIDLKFKDIDLSSLNKNQIFNLKYLVYAGAINNTDYFNGSDNLKVNHYKKILSKAFNILDNNFKDSNFLVSKNLNENSILRKKELINFMDNKFIVNKFIDDKGKLKITYFNFLNNYYKIIDDSKEELKIKINSYDEMYNLLIDMESKNYYKITLTSSRYTIKELYDLYEKIIDDTKAETFKNQHTLFNYKETKNKSQFILIDNKRAYTSNVYNKSLNKFVEVFNTTVSLDKNTYFKEVYEYIYNNYKYTADNFNNMLISNLGNGKMACNGFSRLVFELLTSNNYTVELRGGTSHYWNIVKFDGVNTTVDLTTDILKGYGVTLGLSSDSHNIYIKESGINFYDAEYIMNRYEKVIKNEVNILN